MLLLFAHDVVVVAMVPGLNEFPLVGFSCFSVGIGDCDGGCGLLSWPQADTKPISAMAAIPIPAASCR